MHLKALTSLLLRPWIVCSFVLMFVWVLNIAVYAYLFVKQYQTRASGAKLSPQEEKTMFFVNRWVLFPAASILFWTVPLINRLQGMSDPDNPVFELNMATAILAPIQGLGDSLVYAYLAYIAQAFRKENVAPAVPKPHGMSELYPPTVPKGSAKSVV